MTTYAWQVSDIDVLDALRDLKRPYSDQHVADALAILDLAAVESAALRGDEFDEQADFAAQEIRRQLEGGLA